MKLYEITINPQSAFGTLLRGDTIFGSFCWQAARDPDILNGGLARWMACYHERPCVVFSSAWPKVYDNRSKKYVYALKRPDLPLHWLFPSSGRDRAHCMDERKGNQKRKWMLVGEDLGFSIPGAVFKSDAEICREILTGTPDKAAGEIRSTFVLSHERRHNTINRLSSTTGKAPFTPYSVPVFSYRPFTELAVFVLIDEDATTIEKVRMAMERIGAFGFGKDATTGCGRFIMGEESEEIVLKRSPSANACYALSPTVPEPDAFEDFFASPFTRFGKHGDELARSSHPFKNPVIMADEGAVFIPKNKQQAFSRPFIGRALPGLSKAMPDTVQQGYAVCLPFRLEVMP